MRSAVSPTTLWTRSEAWRATVADGIGSGPDGPSLRDHRPCVRIGSAFSIACMSLLVVETLVMMGLLLAAILVLFAGLRATRPEHGSRPPTRS